MINGPAMMQMLPQQIQQQMVQGAPQQQMIDPRAQYERQSQLANMLMQQSQQYVPNSGVAGALAMMANAWAGKRASGKAEGALSKLLEQEAKSKEEEMKKAMEADAAKRRAEFEDAIRLEAAKQGMKTPDLIRQMQAAGIDPRSPEAQKRILQGTGPQTSVNVNTGKEGPQIGSIPQDFQLVTGEDGSYRMEVIPGSKTALEQQQAAAAGEQSTQEDDAKRFSREQVKAVDVLNINNVIDEAIENTSAWTTGPMRALSVIGGPAADLKADIGVIASDKAISLIGQMKEQSKTGATGFGAMSGPELDLLLNDTQSLDRAQTPGELRKSLQLYKTQYNTVGKLMSLSSAVESGQLPIDQAVSMAEEIKADNVRQRESVLNQQDQPQQQASNPEIDNILQKYLN